MKFAQSTLGKRYRSYVLTFFNFCIWEASGKGNIRFPLSLNKPPYLFTSCFSSTSLPIAHRHVGRISGPHFTRDEIACVLILFPSWGKHGALKFAHWFFRWCAFSLAFYNSFLYVGQAFLHHQSCFLKRPHICWPDVSPFPFILDSPKKQRRKVK